MTRRQIARKLWTYFWLVLYYLSKSEGDYYDLDYIFGLIDWCSPYFASFLTNLYIYFFAFDFFYATKYLKVYRNRGINYQG